MNAIPIRQTGQLLSLFTNGTETLPLAAGEIVTAEVLGTGAGNVATVRLKNAVLDVQTDVSLRKGDLLTLRVEKQENAVYLRLTGSADQSASVRNAALSALAGFEKLKPATESITELVSLLSRLPEGLRENLPEIDVISSFLLQIDRLSGKTLKGMVENGGVFFESKLRILAYGLEADGMTADIEAGRIIAGDLKAALLRLKDTLLSPSVLESLSTRVSTGDLLSALNAVLRNIEYCQLQSKLTDSLHFFLPLVWQQLKDGEIIMREYDHGKQGERSYACTVSLDLERAGKVRVDMLFQGGYIHVTCAAENSGFSQILQDGAQALEGQFKASGIRLGHLSVRHEPGLDLRKEYKGGGLSIRA